VSYLQMYGLMLIVNLVTRRDTFDEPHIIGSGKARRISSSVSRCAFSNWNAGETSRRSEPSPSPIARAILEDCSVTAGR
jgi:hypothetical protein